MATPRWRVVLRRLDRGSWADWVVPAIVAALWAALLGWTEDRGDGLRRTLVAVGGPSVLLAGLHARLHGYLHAPQRQQTLVLPIPAGEHFRAAGVPHRRASLRVWGVGTIAIALGVGPGLATPEGLGLLLDWWMIAFVAMGLEPAIPALGAALGRRFPKGSAIASLQQSLGGGWTLPEAVVHLYAPAIGLGVAMALALPGQLLIDRAADALPIPRGLWIAAGLGAALAWAGPRWGAPWLYARGVFQAVPFLAEATKTLAGPAIPEPSPGWIAWFPSPVVRVWALQFVRLTPAPTLRLLLLVAASLLTSRISSAPVAAGLIASAVLLWLMPARALVVRREARRRWLAALPVDDAARSGRSPAAAVLLAMPPIAACVPLLLRALLP